MPCPPLCPVADPMAEESYGLFGSDGTELDGYAVEPALLPDGSPAEGTGRGFFESVEKNRFYRSGYWYRPVRVICKNGLRTVESVYGLARLGWYGLEAGDAGIWRRCDFRNTTDGLTATLLECPDDPVRRSVTAGHVPFLGLTGGPTASGARPVPLVYGRSSDGHDLTEMPSGELRPAVKGVARGQARPHHGRAKDHPSALRCRWSPHIPQLREDGSDRWGN